MEGEQEMKDQLNSIFQDIAESRILNNTEVK